MSAELTVDDYAAMADELDEVFRRGGYSEEVVVERAGALGAAATALLGEEGYVSFGLLRNMAPLRVKVTEPGSSFKLAILNSPDTTNGHEERVSLVSGLTSTSGLAPLTALALPKSRDQIQRPVKPTKTFFSMDGTRQHTPWFGGDRDNALLEYDAAMHQAARWVGFVLRRQLG